MANDNHTKHSIPVEAGEDFKTALRLAGQTGSTPSSFSSVVRFLLVDHAKNSTSFGPTTKAGLQRLLKGQSIQAPLYFAARTFKSADLESCKNLSSLGLANLFKADELAAVISVMYLARRMRSISDAEEWQHIAKHLDLHANLGALLGIECRALGFAHGLLIGALPSIALASFHKHDVKGFKEYRRLLKSNNISYDHGFEQKKWECTAIQIAAGFVQSTGFGVELAEALSHVNLPAGHAHESELEAKLRAAHFCIQALAGAGKITAETNELQSLDIEESSLDRLIAKAKELKSSTESMRWIDRGKDDLTPEKAPQLFAEQNSAVPQAQEQVSSETVPVSEAPQVYTYETLPADVQAVISKEDFDSMSQDEIAQLIRETVYNPAKEQ